MKGDFTRDTFDLEKHFTRVLMQQGRVQVDADWNEQVSIFTEAIRSLAKDLIGPHGGPGKDPGFKIVPGDPAFTIGQGPYYVDGIRVENTEKAIGYYNQPHYPIMQATNQLPDEYVVYLDVWERFVSFAEEPMIAEVALLGPDTCGRAQLVWQVKVLPGSANNYDRLNDVLGRVIPAMKAEAAKPLASAEPCATSPDARYRGLENQLYRVEIHDVIGQGRAADGALSGVTFKWSRENGSVVFPVKNATGDKVTLAHLGRDPRFGLKVGDWVELIDDDIVLLELAQPLRQVVGIDAARMEVTLAPPLTNARFDPKRHALLRRWDQKESASVPLIGGALKVVEGKLPAIMIEDGIEVTFDTKKAVYRRGDYWLIPARTATGDIEWPRESAGTAQLLPPRGITHHYAPLALGKVDNNGDFAFGDLRFAFKPLAEAV
jgi:hypothetical protein